MITIKKKVQTKHENCPQAETRKTDIFCLFFPLLAQMITAPSATVTLLQASTLGVKLWCDETQLSVKRKRRAKVRQWSADHGAADRHLMEEEEEVAAGWWSN